MLKKSRELNLASIAESSSADLVADLDTDMAPTLLVRPPVYSTSGSQNAGI